MAFILLARAAAGPSAGDTEIINFLMGKGHDITEAADTDALPDTGYDLCIVTESGSSSSTAINSIDTCLLPVMVCETTVNTALLATAAATTAGSGTTVDLQGDPQGLNAGFPDPLTVNTAAASYYGVAASALPSGAEQLAIVPATTHVTAWVLASGATTTSGPAPNKRAAFVLIGSRITGMLAGTDSGNWFNGIVNWLAATGAPPVVIPIKLESGLGFLLTESRLPFG